MARPSFGDRRFPLARWWSEAKDALRSLGEAVVVVTEARPIYHRFGSKSAHFHRGIAQIIGESSKFTSLAV